MRTIHSLSLAAASFLLLLGVGNDVVAQSTGTFRQYQFAAGEDGHDLVLRELTTPVAGPNEVLVRVRATSLNRRDIYILNSDPGQRDNLAGSIPLSDGAGEVIDVGQDVTRFKIGDRVAGTFFSEWTDGQRTAAGLASARGGGGSSGMLSEIVVTHQDGLVTIPEHLSYEEAATLPCAAVTAWVGLFKNGNLEPDEYVLLEGTGGVSTFGLQLAAAAGARPIITSSSNDKLARARDLGAVGTVNYRENEDWQLKVRELTGGDGVDHVLEIGGRETLSKAIEALAFEGHIALIGGLTGEAPPIPVGSLVGSGATASGIYVGSRADFEAMNDFITKHQMRPVVDRVFSFDEAPAAFEFMQNGSYMGKIVIRH